MTSVKAKLILLVILLPAGLKGLWAGLSILRNASSDKIDIVDVNKKISAIKEKMNREGITTSELNIYTSDVLKYEGMLAAESSRQTNRGKIPVACFLIILSLSIFSFWIYAIYRIVTNKNKGSTPNHL